MTTPITSFAELAQLRKKLEQLPQVGDRVAKRAAERFSELARESFDAGEGVSGNSFGPGITLKQSGELRAKALAYTAAGAAIRASVSSVPYARFQLKHNYLPRPGAIPTKWREELARIAGEELRRELVGSAA